jgi:hypothetical protein
MEQTRERLMSFDGNLNFLLDSFMEVSNLLGKKLKKKIKEEDCTFIYMKKVLWEKFHSISKRKYVFS